MKLEWLDIVLMLIYLVIIEVQVSRLKKTVNKLKRDTDNFGDLLGTETSKIRKQQITKEM